MSRALSHKVFVALVVAGAIELASPAKADAPTTQYDWFDQYSVVIHDLKTGLLWQRGYASNVSFDQATTYCQSLSLAPYASGWRVPSYKELLTLVDEHPHSEVLGGVASWKAIDANAFWGTPADNFWSSSRYSGQCGGAPCLSPQAYAVTFIDGTGGLLATGLTNYYVRCVHD